MQNKRFCKTIIGAMIVSVGLGAVGCSKESQSANGEPTRDEILANHGIIENEDGTYREVRPGALLDDGGMDSLEDE